MALTTAAVLLVGMVLATYLATLMMRPRSDARVGGQLGKSSFFIETKGPDTPDRTKDPE